MGPELVATVDKTDPFDLPASLPQGFLSSAAMTTSCLGYELTPLGWHQVEDIRSGTHIKYQLSLAYLDARGQLMRVRGIETVYGCAFNM